MIPHDYAEGNFSILSAKYGAGDRWVDATDVVKGKCRNPFLPFIVTYKEIPDPCWGTRKSLVVRYRWNGRELEGSVPEEEWACLAPEASDAYYASLLSPMFAPILSLPKRHSAEQLAEAVARCGLSDYSDNYPRSLLGFVGKGLNIWQYPNQLAPYLLKAAEVAPRSYLEVGTRFGGTFAFTTEYLRFFGGLDRAVGIDMLESPFIRGYAAISPHVRFRRGNAHDSAILPADCQPFDLVMLDGSHDEDGVRLEFGMYSPGCKAVAIHDICDENFSNSVPDFWNSLKREKSGEFEFYEFVDQYPDVWQVGKKFLGIGLAIRK